MKNKIIDKLYNFILSNKKCSEKQKKIYKYGLEGLYNLLTKIIVLLIISIFLKLTKELIILILFYSFIRMYAFGIHAESSIGCWISTLLVYILGSFIIKHLYLPNYLYFIICITSLILILLFAPADTPKRPIINQKNRKKLKIKSLIIGTTYIIILFFSKNYHIIKNAVTFSMLQEAVCINPLTYFIFHTPYNNYKNYIKKA